MKISEEKRKIRDAERMDRLRDHREKVDAEIAERKRIFLEMTDQQIAERQRKFYEGKKADTRAYWRKWSKANSEICSWRTHVNRAWRGGKSSYKVIGLSREMTKTVWNERRSIARKYFRKGDLHHDHMMPLASGKSDSDRRDLNHFTNFVFIPKKANLSKGAKPFWEWFATLTDKKLIKCISAQDAYNKKIQRQLECHPTT